MTEPRFAGLDVGDARIGIALADPGLSLATPLTIIQRTKGRPAEKVANLLRERDITDVVIGLPRNMDGTLGPQARKCQNFGEKLQEAWPEAQLHYWDERLSTQTAREMRILSGAGRKKRAQPIDAEAAAVILQEFLDHRTK